MKIQSLKDLSSGKVDFLWCYIILKFSWWEKVLTKQPSGRKAKKWPTCYCTHRQVFSKCRRMRRTEKTKKTISRKIMKQLWIHRHFWDFQQLPNGAKRKVSSSVEGPLWTLYCRFFILTCSSLFSLSTGLPTTFLAWHSLLMESSCSIWTLWLQAAFSWGDCLSMIYFGWVSSLAHAYSKSIGFTEIAFRSFHCMHCIQYVTMYILHNIGHHYAVQY